MKKIIYLVQWFRPTKEATSKEVNTLFQYFKKKSVLHDLHLNKIFKFRFNPNRISYHFTFYPLFFPLLYFYSLISNRIIHVYGCLIDRPYLLFLPKQRMVLTSTNFFRQQRIKKRLKALRKTSKIVVEAEIQKKELLKSGIEENKIALIYPSINLDQFTHQKAKGTFKILNATCPSRVRDFKRRGMDLLLKTDPFLDDKTIINLTWRDGFDLIKKVIKNKNFNSLRFKNKIIKNMNGEFAQTHCTISPYIRLDEYLKLVPLSAIESLAAGKPLLVSSQTGIAEIVKQERCGVVFEPKIKDLLKAIIELKNNYKLYQSNCRKTAEKYFAQEKFIKKYQKIYQEL